MMQKFRVISIAIKRCTMRVLATLQLRPGRRIRLGKVEASFACEVVSAAQPPPRLEEAEARPADFANASPFPRRRTKQDPARTAIFAAVALAFLAFIASMIALFFMKPPTL